MLSQKQIFWREFSILFGIAMAVSCIYLWLIRIPLVVLANAMPVPIFILKSTLELAAAVSVGLWAAHRVGLGTPILERWLRGEPKAFPPRRSFLPIALTATLVAIISHLAVLPIFNPNQKQNAAAMEEIINNAGTVQLPSFMQYSSPLTPVSQAVSWIDRAVVGELNGRLFMVSVFVLIAGLIARRTIALPDTSLFWAAIFGVLLFHLCENVHRDVVEAHATQFFYTHFHLARDPLWLAVFRGSLGTTTRDIGFGWVYVNFGIEYAIMTSFLAAVIAQVLFRVVFIYFM